MSSRSALLLSLVGAAEGIAQKWPERPVKLVVPYPAGSGTDTVARVMVQKLGDTLGQRFVVENRAGASGSVRVQAVAKVEPEGYTLLVGSPAEVTLNQTLFKDLPFDPLTIEGAVLAGLVTATPVYPDLRHCFRCRPRASPRCVPSTLCFGHSKTSMRGTGPCMTAAGRIPASVAFLH